MRSTLNPAGACGQALLDVLVDHLLRQLDDAFATERFEDPTRCAVGLRRESEMGAHLRERTNTTKLVVSQQRSESISDGDTSRLRARHGRVAAASRSQFVALCLQDFARLFHISLARALTDKAPAMADRVPPELTAGLLVQALVATRSLLLAI